MLTGLSSYAGGTRKEPVWRQIRVGAGLDSGLASLGIRFPAMGGHGLSSKILLLTVDCGRFRLRATTTSRVVREESDDDSGQFTSR